MKLIINDTDMTTLIGEPFELRGETYMPLSFIHSLKQEGLTLTTEKDTVRITATPDAIRALLAPKNHLPADLELKMETDDQHRLIAKAEVTVGDIGRASIDHTGKIEAGVKFRL